MRPVIRCFFARALAAAALMFAAGGQSAAQSPAPPYPPPGILVDVGGHRVHLYCTGEGNPAVIIVGGGFSFDWSLVQSAVAKHTRVCTYDASGTAWSDSGPLLDCADRVNEVHSLLSKAEVKGPYVLVGLSIGALVARLYADQHASDVAGIVLVDHAFLDTAIRNASPAAIPGLDSPPVLISQTPIVLTVEETSDFDKLPQRAKELHRWAVSLHPALPTVETAQDCLFHLKKNDPALIQLRSLPLAVVSTANDQPKYKKLQSELLALSQRSQQFMADRSFHSVEIDQPEVVVDAIRLVVEMVRSSKATERP